MDRDYYLQQAVYWQRGAAMYHRHVVESLARGNPDAAIRAMSKGRIAHGTSVDYVAMADSVQTIYALQCAVNDATWQCENARDALKPLAQMDALTSEPGEPETYAFDPWRDESVVFDIGKRKITAGDLRRAREALS